MDSSMSDRPTDEEILAFSQAIQEEAIEKTPLIGPAIQVSTLKREYNDNPILLAKLDALCDNEHGGGMHRTRRDGNCFYRAFAYTLLLSALMSDTRPRLVAQLQGTTTLLDRAGFAAIVYEDFLETCVDMIQSCNTTSKLLDNLNDAEGSNGVVVYLRFLTSAQMRVGREVYLAYLGEGEVLERWCERWVEAMGAEADNIQIHALVNALNVGVDVVHLDNTKTTDGRANVLQMRPDEGAVTAVVQVLFRPGHYDVLL